RRAQLEIEEPMVDALHRHADRGGLVLPGQRREAGHGSNHSYPRGFAPRTPLHALSRAAAPPRSVRVAHSLRSFAPTSHPGVVFDPRGFAPRTPLHALSRAAAPPRSVFDPRGFAPRTPLHAL